jgi:hypothetical protein
MRCWFIGRGYSEDDDEDKPIGKTADDETQTTKSDGGSQPEIERLELRIAELIKERDQYDARRREAMEKLEEYRTECLDWREWKKYVTTEYKGVYGSSFPVIDMEEWSELEKDHPWPW